MKDVEFHINEWGMSSHFQKTVAEYPDLHFRNSEESPLFLVKMVDNLFAIEDNYDFPTSMLLYWGGAWEAEKDEFFLGNRGLTTAGNIPKPIQTGYEMLAQLGEDRLEVSGPRIGRRYGVLATKSSKKEVQLIVYNYNETDDNLNISDDIAIDLSGLAKGNYTIEEYSLDRENNNTYREWQKQGSPKTSKDADLKSLQKAADLSVTKSSKGKSTNGDIKLEMKLPRHSMKLIKIIIN
jgi:xylan 1,4-beta-xylosidase